MTLYYGFGFNFVTNCDLEKKVSTQNSNPPDIEANDMTGGLYLKRELKLSLINFCH